MEITKISAKRAVRAIAPQKAQVRLIKKERIFPVVRILEGVL